MEPQLNGAPIGEDGRARCAWALSHPLNLHYHDTEWGMPVHGDQALFERIMLDALIWSHKPATTPAHALVEAIGMVDTHLVGCFWRGASGVHGG